MVNQIIELKLENEVGCCGVFIDGTERMKISKEMKLIDKLLNGEVNWL